MNLRTLVFFLLLVTLAGALSCSQVAPTPSAQTYTLRVLNTYPHDPGAFTEGLTFDGSFLYEGTGLYGQSSLRRVELETGRVLEVYSLPPEYFGEGIAIRGDSIVQLTWQSGIGFIYDRDSFERTGDFTYATEGWGITYDGSRFIMSDGTSTLYFLDDSLRPAGHIKVNDNGAPVSSLNELEYINGRVYANVWHSDSIAIIDPDSGKVEGRIDLSGLLPSGTTGADVLNGIAYDSAGRRLFVTGKLWPSLFEIELVPE